MARGIGGDDGPSLWMFAACILIYGKLASWGKSAKDELKHVSDEISTTANPIQAQTSDQLAMYKREVDSWAVNWTGLPKPQSHYQNMASKLWAELRKEPNVDEDKIIAMCKPYSAPELKAIAKSFGVKKERTFGLTVWEGHIFAAFDEVFEDGLFSTERTDLYLVWSKTGLWQ